MIDQHRELASAFPLTPADQASLRCVSWREPAADSWHCRVTFLDQAGEPLFDVRLDSTGAAGEAPPWHQWSTTLLVVPGQIT